MTEHTHEEADTIIPLHVLDVIRMDDKHTKTIDIFSPDTDIFILLMDLISNCSNNNNVNFVTGKGCKRRKININERCFAIGNSKAQGLIGLHAFTDGEWGEKFFGISKERWNTAYLNIPNDSELIAAFRHLGNAGDPLSNLPAFEKFIGLVYAENYPSLSVPEVRWHQFRTKRFEGEKLPPTMGALKPHLLRANIIATISKGYKVPRPSIPPLVGNGWEVDNDQKLLPVKCNEPPAPISVIELVKCGCRGVCESGQCSCVKNSLMCTALCKCSDCHNIKDYTCEDNDGSDSE